MGIGMLTALAGGRRPDGRDAVADSKQVNFNIGYKMQRFGIASAEIGRDASPETELAASPNATVVTIALSHTTDR